jgi:putative hydrolase of the HAD superfamily
VRPPARAVLFDATGTLIELREPAAATYARIAGECGIRAAPTQLGDALAQSLQRAPEMAFPTAAADEIDALERAWWRDVALAAFRASGTTAPRADLDACFERLFSAFAAPRAWRATAGAHESLATLRRRGLATGVVSNFDRRLEGILDGLDLAVLLDVVVLPADVGVTKPDPAIFARALGALVVEASEAIFVGDQSERDLDGARRAGMCAIDARSLATLAELPDRVAARARASEKETR